MAADNRPSWDEYFMKMANDVATRTTCLRRGVGAVIVKDRRILATGYNGVPTGLTHCSETGCLREQLGVPSGQRHEICRGLHAEQNAIIQAARYGINIAGATIYVNTQPCVVCAKMLINAGIDRDRLPEPVPRRAVPGAFGRVRHPRPGVHGGVDQGKVGDRSDGRADGLRFSAPAQIFPDQGRKPPPRSFHRSPQKLVELVSFCEQDVIIGNGLHWV